MMLPFLLALLPLAALASVPLLGVVRVAGGVVCSSSVVVRTPCVRA